MKMRLSLYNEINIENKLNESTLKNYDLTAFD
jgi:hypothetical protein